MARLLELTIGTDLRIHIRFPTEEQARCYVKIADGWTIDRMPSLLVWQTGDLVTLWAPTVVKSAYITDTKVSLKFRDKDIAKAWVDELGIWEFSRWSFNKTEVCLKLGMTNQELNKFLELHENRFRTLGNGKPASFPPRSTPAVSPSSQPIRNQQGPPDEREPRPARPSIERG